MAEPVVTTQTTYTDGTTITASGGSNAAGSPSVTVIENIFDASRRGLAHDGTDYAVAEVLKIPAKTRVLNVFYEVLTADASQTINIGDGTTVDGYLAAADVGTDGNVGCSTLALTTGTPNTVTGYSGGKFYSAADTIDIVPHTSKTLDTLKIRICATVVQFG
jgi:hypothetical protein